MYENVNKQTLEGMTQNLNFFPTYILTSFQYEFYAVALICWLSVKLLYSDLHMR